MAEHKTIIVDRNSNNKEISVVCGDVIQIELESKGATGYQWHIEQITTEYTELLSEGSKDISKDKAGAPVMGYWSLKALKKGTAEILMRYYRSWEGPEKALEQFRIKVKISESMGNNVTFHIFFVSSLAVAGELTNLQHKIKSLRAE